MKIEVLDEIGLYTEGGEARPVEMKNTEWMR
jgi:hypothetical protein